MIRALEDRTHPFYLILLCSCISFSAFTWIRHRHQTPAAADSFTRETMINNQRHTLSAMGLPIKFGADLDLINDPESVPALPPKDAYVLLYINDLSCNVCADAETKFANGLAQKFGTDRVLAVVHTATRRAAINFARLNKATFPVLYDQDNLFASENDLKYAPQLLVVSAEGKVLYSHLPIVGEETLCQPAHEFFERSLAVISNR